MKLDVLKHMVGIQEVLVWLFGGHWKKGVEFSKRGFVSCSKGSRPSLEIIEGTG